MKPSLYTAIFFELFLWSIPSQAMLLDANVFYISDTFTPSGSSTVATYSNYDIRIGFAVDKKNRFFAGWNYSLVSASTQVSSGTTLYSSAEMGPSFLYTLNKARTWILSFSYNLLSTATYTPAGGTAEVWKGATLKVSFGYTIEIGEGWFFGPTLSYYSAAFTEKIVNDRTYTTESNTRAQMFPSLYIGVR